MTRLLTVFFAWIAVYVTVTSTLMGFRWAGLNISLPVQTLILTVFLVPTMIFYLGPFAAKLAQSVMRRSS